MRHTGRRKIIRVGPCRRRARYGQEHPHPKCRDGNEDRRTATAHGISFSWRLDLVCRLGLKDLHEAVNLAGMRPLLGAGTANSSHVILERALLARAAPMAVFTSFCSSGGGSTAARPRDCIQSSRPHPVVW